MKLNVDLFLTGNSYDLVYRDLQTCLLFYGSPTPVFYSFYDKLTPTVSQGTTTVSRESMNKQYTCFRTQKYILTLERK